MGYLDQFARNKRDKEKSEVLTARLPKNLYDAFKGRCEELGLSISEAVYLLVEQEIEGIQANKNTIVHSNDESVICEVYNENEHETKPITEEKQNDSKVYTKRFITKQWQVESKLPCPVCDKWVVANNFSKHAKTHGSTTVAIFTSDQYQNKITAMVAEEIKVNQK